MDQDSGVIYVKNPHDMKKYTIYGIYITTSFQICRKIAEKITTFLYKKYKNKSSQLGAPSIKKFKTSRFINKT